MKFNAAFIAVAVVFKAVAPIVAAVVFKAAVTPLAAGMAMVVAGIGIGGGRYAAGGGYGFRGPNGYGRRYYPGVALGIAGAAACNYSRLRTVL